MYFQKRLAALYVFLSAIFTKPTGCLSNSQRPLSDWGIGLRCFHPHVNHPDGAASTDLQPIDRPGCAITMNCLPEGRSGPAILGNGPMPSLSVMLTLPEDLAMDMQRCKKELGELLFRGREDVQVVGTSVTRQLDSEEDCSHRDRPPTPLYSRQQQESVEADSEEQDYRGIFEYLMSTIQRRATQMVDCVKEHKANFQNRLASRSDQDSTSNFSMDLKQVIFNKRSFSYYVTQCDESFCDGYDLEKICDPNSRTRRKAKLKNICGFCYPQRKNAFIKHHCEKRIKKEIRAFYGICALLAVSIVFAIILYVLHRTGRLLRINCRLIRGMRRSRFPSNPVTSNKFSSAVFSDNPMGSTRRSEDTTSNPDYVNDSTTFSMFERKFNQLGASRVYRKRIQDVFDIESLEPKHVKEENLKDRVFVLPQAPNATVRRKSADSLRRVRGGPCGPGHIEMEEVQFDTVRRVFAHDQSVF